MFGFKINQINNNLTRNISGKTLTFATLLCIMYVLN